MIELDSLPPNSPTNNNHLNHLRNIKIDKTTKTIRFHTEGSEDKNIKLSECFSIPRFSHLQPRQSENTLRGLLKRGLSQRKKVMKNLLPLNSSTASIYSLPKKQKLKQQQKQNIKTTIRNTITRHSTTRRKEHLQQEKWLQQSFNKIFKELKHKCHHKREQDNNDNNDNKIESYAATIKGDKHHVNQDALAFSEGLYFICDGHGTNGKQIAEFVVETAHRMFLQAYNQKKIDTHHIRNILKKLEIQLDISGIDIAFSGCTFLGIIALQNTIYSISVGDSKTILTNGINTLQLSTLHKPDLPSEKNRIEAAGGVIHPLQIGKDKYSGPNRIWAPGKNSWGPGLALSRAFGDKAARKYGVISEPDIKNIRLTEAADFLVMGSDGLYDYMKDNEISFFVRKKLREDGANRENIALQLVEEARRIGSFESDDISCIIILL